MANPAFCTQINTAGEGETQLQETLDRGTSLAQLAEHVTLGLGILSMNPTLGVLFT